MAPCIVNRNFTSYHWIYWVGPISGVILAVLFYKLVKALEYETAHTKAVAEEELQSLPAHNKRKSSSIIPLASIHPGGNLTRRSSRGSHHSEIRTQSIKAAPVPAALAAKTKEKSDDNSVLPACYVD
jgi:aquaporin related protein